MALSPAWLQQRLSGLLAQQQQEDEEQYRLNAFARAAGQMPRSPWLGERGYVQSIQRKAEIGDLGRLLGVSTPQVQVIGRAPQLPPSIEEEGMPGWWDEEERQYLRNLRSDQLRQHQLALRQLAAQARASELAADEASLFGREAAYSPVRRQQARTEAGKDIEAEAAAQLRTLWEREPYEQAVAERRLREVYERYGRPAELRAGGQIGAAEARTEGDVYRALTQFDAATLNALARVANAQPLTPEDRQRVQRAFEAIRPLVPEARGGAVVPGGAAAPEGGLRPMPRAAYDTLRELVPQMGEDELRQWLRRWGYRIEET